MPKKAKRKSPYTLSAQEKDRSPPTYACAANKSGGELYAPALGIVWPQQPKSKSRRSERSDRPKKWEPASKKVTPPSYSVVEDSEGDLWAPALGVRWPERPRKGKYSKESRIAASRDRIKKPHKEPPRKQSPSPVSADAAILMYRPRGPLTALDHRYIGLATEADAEEKCNKRNVFHLYHAVPDVTLDTVQLILPLTVVYKTSLGHHKHYAVRTYQHQQQTLYYIDCGEEKQAFASIEAMVEYHQVYSYIVPSEYQQPGAMARLDTFPWWQDERHE